MELAIFKLSAKVTYETERLPLKNSFVWPLVYLGARVETSWVLKQRPDSLQSANLINLHPKAAKANSANKGGEKSGFHRLTRLRKAALKL